MNTAIPNGTGNFTSFMAVGPPITPAIDGTSVAFFGAGSSGQQGIYVMQAGPPIRVADASTAIPGGTGNFTSFGDVSLSTTDIAFLGMGAAGQQGIYDLTGGSLRKVVDLNDILNGRSITGLGLSPTGVSGDPIAFQATFADGSQGMYVWTLPPLAGDFNHNGVVDAADYAVWRNGLGTTYTQTDFDLWKAHFGETQSGSGAYASGASRAVPEPTAEMLSFLAAVVIAAARARLVG